MTKPDPSKNYGTFKNRVLSCSDATRGTREVLMALVHLGIHRTDLVVTTKNQIADFLNRKTVRCVQLSLQQLKRAGTIEVVSGGRGGKSVAVTYRLCIPVDYVARDYDQPEPAPAPHDFEELSRMSYSALTDPERAFLRKETKRRLR